MFDRIAKLIIEKRLIDSVWPSGFISFVLWHVAQFSKNNIVKIHDIELAAAVADEINSFDFNGLKVNAVIADNPDWTLRLKPDVPNIVFDVGAVEPLFQAEVQFKRIACNEHVALEELIESMIESGYRRVGYAESEGEFALRGGILDVFPFGSESPKRIEFFGDTVESIREFDPVTQLSVGKIDEFLLPLKRRSVGNGSVSSFYEIDVRPNLGLLRVVPNRRYVGRFELMREDVERFRRQGFEIYILSDDERRGRRLAELLDAKFMRGHVFHGFAFDASTLADFDYGGELRHEFGRKLAVFSDKELSGAQPRRRRKQLLFGERIEDLTTILPGDLVVHVDYGIAKFEGLRKVEFEGTAYDCLSLRFKDGRVYVPTYNLEKVQRFTTTSDEEQKPEITEIGSPRWARRRAKAVLASFELADEILKIHALRRAKKGFAFSPDSELQAQLEASFPYEETEDQKRAIEEVKRDMESERVMDRLVAGEVGFGKTEVALRAAFKAVQDSKQVAIVVPTTILALQHYRTFTERLKDFPVRVEMVSRLVNSKRIKEILRDLAEGKVDIVIGTHRLLRDDVKFKDLGLLIIDEEHRFGVRQKEVLRRRYPLVDTLRLTATPIPRTLYAALGKIYDLSIILTPPIGRLPVETIVAEYDDELVIDAIEREIRRDGQVFYIFNRIKGIDEVAERLRNFFPELRIAVAHGRMPRSKLEDIFIEFYEGKIDVLVSTSIIEAGVDFPRANTLIVERADRFGLAELHQLRGRVGRSIVKAYAYFLVPKKISERAKQRLRALATYHHLGSGLKIALADMEIRGAGNLLGKEQHGHINAVGVELFFTLLEEAVRRLSGEEIPQPPEVKLRGVTALLPESYIPEAEVRIAFYRRISSAGKLDELDAIRRELRDRFGR
ncbi:MAG: transcription-repair coupling factor, partial [Candidatus Hydrothermota bacterium]